MSDEALKVAAELERARAIITGSHVVYASGTHGSAYVNKDALYPDTRRVGWLCSLLAAPFYQDMVAAVVGPSLGGIILSQHVADALCGNGGYCESLYAEKDGKGGYVLNRGYDLRVKNRRVLVVEDVLTTGTSARSTVEAVRLNGGDVVGVAALVNRGGVTAKDVGDVPKLHVLLTLHLETFPEAACPLCAQGVPVNTSVGKGAEYLARRAGAMT